MRSALDRYSHRMAAFFEEIVADAVQRGQSGATDVAARGNALYAFVEGILLVSRMRNDSDLILKMLPQAEALLKA